MRCMRLRDRRKISLKTLFGIECSNFRELVYRYDYKTDLLVDGLKWINILSDSESCHRLTDRHKTDSKTFRVKLSVLGL